MRSISRYLPSLLIGTLLFGATLGYPQVSSPTAVLEASETIHGVGDHQETWLLIRLVDDGKLEWDTWVGKARERQKGSVSIERVSDIKQGLGAIDRSRIRNKMGPYHTYTDTIVELRVRLTNSRGELTFTVINPWSCVGCPRKPLPNDVKTVVCAISRVRTQVVPEEPIDPMCKTFDTSQ